MELCGLNQLTKLIPTHHHHGSVPHFLVRPYPSPPQVPPRTALVVKVPMSKQQVHPATVEPQNEVGHTATPAFSAAGSPQSASTHGVGGGETANPHNVGLAASQSRDRDVPQSLSTLSNVNNESRPAQPRVPPSWLGFLPGATPIDPFFVRYDVLCHFVWLGLSMWFTVTALSSNWGWTYNDAELTVWGYGDETWSEQDSAVVTQVVMYTLASTSIIFIIAQAFLQAVDLYTWIYCVYYPKLPFFVFGWGMVATGVRIVTLLAATVIVVIVGANGADSIIPPAGGWFFVAAMFEGAAMLSTARLARTLPLAARSLQEQDVQQAPFEPPKRTSHDGPPQLANLWHCVAPRRLVGFDKSAVSCTLGLHTCCSILAVLASILGISLPWGFTQEQYVVDVWGLAWLSWSELSVANDGVCHHQTTIPDTGCLVVVALAQSMTTLAGACIFFMLVQCVWVGMDMFMLKFRIFVWDSPSFLFWTATANAAFRLILLIVTVAMYSVLAYDVANDYMDTSSFPLGQSFLLLACVCDSCAALLANALSKNLTRAALRHPNAVVAAETYAERSTSAPAPV